LPGRWDLKREIGHYILPQNVRHSRYPRVAMPSEGLYNGAIDRVETEDPPFTRELDLCDPESACADAGRPTPIEIRAATSGDWMNKLTNILVPVSGNPIDEEAIGLACRVAKGSKGKVYAVYVVEVNRTLPLDAELAGEVQKGESILDEAERVAAELSYEIESEVLQAREVGPALVDEAIERGIDLIVLGITYKKRFGEFHMGKVVPYILKNAPCRVWMVREAISS